MVSDGCEIFVRPSLLSIDQTVLTRIRLDCVSDVFVREITKLSETLLIASVDYSTEMTAGAYINETTLEIWYCTWLSHGQILLTFCPKLFLSE